MKNITQFIKIETTGARLLLGATILALVLSNLPWYPVYEQFFQGHHVIKVVINDGLMAIFFLVVGMEIKYELLAGSLNSIQKALLPGIAALGGMVVPALIYLACNYQHADTLIGWAVPTATDIAFALSVISLLGSKIPSTLKTFLMALAIIDDLAAIVLIAVFYTGQISFLYLGCAGLCLLLLFLFNISGVRRYFPYAVVGLVMWWLFYQSGVHATLAGVALAMMIPLPRHVQPQAAPLKQWLLYLHPWVALVILPLFAFANAGVAIVHVFQADLQWRVMLGVMLGLFVGKQIGVFGASFIAVKLGLARLPEDVKWLDLYAVAILCGIGFTISLLIGTLAFDEQVSYLNAVKLGVLAGSLLSGVVGYGLLRR